MLVVINRNCIYEQGVRYCETGNHPTWLTFVLGVAFTAAALFTLYALYQVWKLR